MSDSHEKAVDYLEMALDFCIPPNTKFSEKVSFLVDEYRENDGKLTVKEFMGD